MKQCKQKKQSSLPQKKQRNGLVFRNSVLENGATKDLSCQSELQEDKDCTTSMTSLIGLSTNSQIQQKKKRVKKNSATVESLQSDKKKIYKGKLSTCKRNSQNTKLSQILAQESTSSEKVYEPSWSCHAKEMSPRLWLPTEIDSVGSPLNSLNGSFISMESNSWYSMKAWKVQETQSLQKTFSASSTYSIAELMEKENIKLPKERKNKLQKTTKNVANKCRKIQLKPTSQVANQLRRWFGCCRKTYNWALSCIKDKPQEYKKDISWLRKRFINEDKIPKEMNYLLQTPKHVRDSAIIDLVEAFKSNKSKQKKNPSFKFEIKFRSKKNNQCITIPNDSIKSFDTDKNELSVYPTYLKNKIKFHCRKVPKDIKYDCKLLLDTRGRLILCVPCYEDADDNQVSKKKHSWCSLDPGVRNFMTVYSPTPGICYLIGSNDISRIYRLCRILDELMSIKVVRKNGRTKQSTKTKVFVNNKHRFNKAKAKLRDRIKTLVDEVHWKTINFLTSNFNNIILPPFNVSHMVKHKNRKISKKSVRQMLCWKHYTFRKRLQDYVASLPNTNLFIRTEDYTSKTCTSCQQIKHNLGGAKIFNCPHCNIKINRDVVGARNIFIKNAIASLDFQ